MHYILNLGTLRARVSKHYCEKSEINVNVPYFVHSGHLVPSPILDLLMLQLLRPNSSNLPCLYSTFHLEYPLVLSRFCFVERQATLTNYKLSFLLFGIKSDSRARTTISRKKSMLHQEIQEFSSGGQTFHKF